LIRSFARQEGADGISQHPAGFDQRGGEVEHALRTMLNHDGPFLLEVLLDREVA